MPPGPPQTQVASAAGNQTIVTTTELAVVTVTGVNTPQGGGRVILEGELQIAIGTTTSSVTLNIRRGTGITGTIIATTSQGVPTAGSTFTIPIQGVDNLGEAAGQSYTLTVTQTAATANGTASNATLQATF